MDKPNKTFPLTIEKDILEGFTIWTTSLPNENIFHTKVFFIEKLIKTYACFSNDSAVRFHNKLVFMADQRCLDKFLEDDG